MVVSRIYGRMTPARAFTISIAMVAAIAVMPLSAGISLLALCVPPLVLFCVAIFGGGATGWGTRAMRGTLRGLIAAVLAIVAVRVLRGHTDWYDWPDEQGGHLFMLLLALLAAVPAAIAGAARRSFRHALVAGFDVGIAAWALTWAMPLLGVLVLVALGTLVGVLAHRDSTTSS
jgi:hypothetical protein